MIKILILIQFFFYSISIYSNPIISIKENKTSKISKFSPYIYGIKNQKVILLSNEKLINFLKINNIKYDIIYSSEKKYLLEKKSIINNENFIKYNEISDKIDKLVKKYPNLIKKITIGKSTEGRDIIGIKTIVNNFSPKYRIVGGTHGDEAMSYQFVFDFMVYLIENNKKFQDIINNTQIYFIPMINPDGASNITRRNSNNIDLNRNMGFFWRRLMFSGSKPFSELETRALRDFTLNENFTMSFSFHTFGNIINYVWNFSPDNVADIYEIINISNLYNSFTDYKVSDGYKWYQTTGDLNDYSYGTVGTLDWTIEIDDSDKDKKIFNINKEALIKILRLSKYGLEGVIHDENNNPITASIIIDGNSLFYNNKNGYFYRYLLNGVHYIKIIAQGYNTYSDFIRIDFNKPFLDIKLKKSKNITPLFISKVISVKADLYKNEYNNVLLPKNLLFLPDNKYFKLPLNGEILLKLPNRNKEKFLDIILDNYYDIDLIIKGYKNLDDDEEFSENYNNINQVIKINKNIKYLKIIEKNTNYSSKIDSILLKDYKETVKNPKNYTYKGSGACNFNINHVNYNILVLIIFILNVYIIRRRKKIEKK